MQIRLNTSAPLRGTFYKSTRAIFSFGSWFGFIVNHFFLSNITVDHSRLKSCVYKTAIFRNVWFKMVFTFYIIFGNLYTTQTTVFDYKIIPIIQYNIHHMFCFQKRYHLFFRIFSSHLLFTFCSLWSIIL